jgi:hypothetical protein
MHTLTHPIPTHAPQSHSERGAYIIELKRRYDEGTLLTQVTADMITDLLLDALFSETSTHTTTVH